jgi:hypothetical protein
MPQPTYVPMATITLGSSASSISFSSIPATYRDVIVVFNGITSATSTDILWRVNDDTGSNYSRVQAVGVSSGPISNAQSSATSGFVGGTFLERTVAITQFMDYSATDKHKTSLSRCDSPTTQVHMSASRWANTAAITKITFILSGGNFATGSTFALYGIAS